MSNEISLTLISEIRTPVSEAKQQATIVVNVTLTQLYWQIGERINREILDGE